MSRGSNPQARLYWRGCRPRRVCLQTVACHPSESAALHLHKTVTCQGAVKRTYIYLLRENYAHQLNSHILIGIICKTFTNKPARVSRLLCEGSVGHFEFLWREYPWNSTRKHLNIFAPRFRDETQKLERTKIDRCRDVRPFLRHTQQAQGNCTLTGSGFTAWDPQYEAPPDADYSKASYMIEPVGPVSPNGAFGRAPWSRSWSSINNRCF